MSKLAIVIPAYKIDFFEETLSSIANQTCKDFTLYIGDDCSPNNLYAIVCKYEGFINIVYKKFEKNIGGTDLVAQWERCVDMVQDEEWIWLFSDDDTMELNCVEEFYKYIDANKNVDLLHFNVNVIDSQGTVIENLSEFPKLLKTADFFKERINYKINSFIVEYIFKRNLFLSKGKFENFDLAWCSDDATWIKFSGQNGINTICTAYINWRMSESNISSVFDNKEIVLRKLSSNINYLKWVKSFFSENNISIVVSYFNIFRWGIMPIKSSSSFSLREKIKHSIIFCKQFNKQTFIPIAIVYILITEVKTSLKLQK